MLNADLLQRLDLHIVQLELFTKKKEEKKTHTPANSSTQYDEVGHV